MAWRYSYPDDYEESPWVWDDYRDGRILDITNRKDLEKLMTQVKHQEDKGFPKKYVILAHANRENNRLLGEKLGLSGNDLARLRNAFLDVLIYVTVSETGTYETDRIVTNGVDYIRNPEVDTNWDEYEVYRG